MLTVTVSTADTDMLISLQINIGEEIQQCTECTYLDTKIDQLGDNTTEIKHRTKML
jgi:hypothetical protein